MTRLLHVREGGVTSRHDRDISREALHSIEVSGSTLSALG